MRYCVTAMAWIACGANEARTQAPIAPPHEQEVKDADTTPRPDATQSQTVEADAQPPPPFDFKVWGSAHGVDWNAKGNDLSIEGDCHLVRVGDPLREAAWCERGTAFGVTQFGAALFPLWVIDVDEKKHLRVLLHLPLSAGWNDALPRVGSHGEPVTFVKLTAALSEDGQSITLHEELERPCRTAIAEVRGRAPSDQAERQGQREQLDVMNQVCKSAGRYGWQRGRFARVP